MPRHSGAQPAAASLTAAAAATSGPTTAWSRGAGLGLLAALTLMPVAIMTSRGAPSVVFYLAVLFALLLLPGARQASATLRRHGWVLAALATPALAVLFAALWHGRLSGTDLETTLRLALGAAVVLAALSTQASIWVQRTTVGFAVAALGAAAWVAMLATEQSRPITDAIYNAVGYGSLLALFAFIVLYSLAWRLTRWPRVEALVKAAVVVFAIVGVFLTQTRTAWLAVPVFVVIAVVLFMPPRKHPGRTVVGVLLALLVAAALFAASGTMRQRAQDAYQEAVQCTTVDATGFDSICVRMQLLRAAWQAFVEQPVAGLGTRRDFNGYLNEVALPAGVVSPTVANGWGEPHNDLLFALASFGLPGGLALLLAYLAPAWVFARRLSSRYPQAARTAAAMGLALCFGFLLFGLPETMWRSMRTVSFYGLGVALFLALSERARSHGADTA